MSTDEGPGYALRAHNIECSICGKGVYDWQTDNPCPHVPGEEYEVDGMMVRAVGYIREGKLMYVSVDRKSLNGKITGDH